MNPIWTRTLLLLVTLALVAWIVDAFSGAANAMGLLACGVLILYLRDKHYLYKLWSWVASDQNARPPIASGAWEDLLAQLYKQNRRNLLQKETLTEALLRFQGAAQALPDGVITLNDENQIIWFNTQAREHYGLRFPVDTGQNITNLLRSPDFLAYLNQSKWETPIVIRIRGPQIGAERPTDLLERVLSIQLVGYGEAQKLLLSRDVTKLEKLETVRRDFVANVSHELKTPLTVLSGFLETIREFRPPPKQQEHYLKLMSEQAERMERLVSDLLTLSSLESNNNPADEPIVMTRLLTQLEATARSLSGEQHRIEFKVEAGLDLLGAEAELTSAFTNLVTNAVRYTPAGGSIQVSWQSLAGTSSNSADQEARFSVSDTGIGIPAQHLPRLTERFYRVDRGRSRESGGTGLGLAIVKHVLTRHQGRLEIESTVGSGSRFNAVLPARRLVRTAPPVRDAVSNTLNATIGAPVQAPVETAKRA